MRKTVFALLVASLAAGCDTGTSLDDEWNACVDRVSDIMPDEVTLSFSKTSAIYYDNRQGGITFKNGWTPMLGGHGWTNGVESKGENPSYFYQITTGNYERWLTYGNYADGGSLENKNLITFLFRLVLDPIDGSVAPDDGVAVDFRVVDVVFEAPPSCQWQGG